MANDYNNLYLAYKLTSPACNKQNVFEFNINQSGVITNVLSKASESKSGNGVVEYKIPLASIGLAQGMSFRASFKAFYTCNLYPASGSANVQLEAEKCWMQRVYNDIEANCMWISQPCEIEQCNARIGEEKITHFNPTTMRFYRCALTVETPDSMYGEYFVVPEVEDLDGQKVPADENEFWFFNPNIALAIDGVIDFGTVRPGTVSYADTLLVGNDADDSSGVILDMFIAGTDFYDPTSSGAKCPTTNQLALTNYAYHATNGRYSTASYPGSDIEGYRTIPYGDRITQGSEIISGRKYSMQPLVMPITPGNSLVPGSEMAVTFRLSLPEPCNGNFNSGSIFFWGEAV
jgi:hypothetical protein